MKKSRNFVVKMGKEQTYRQRIDQIVRNEKRYRDPNFSAMKLAESLEVQNYELSRIIRREYGTTYTDIIHSYRIQEAMRHLKNKRLAPYSIDDIGWMVGFKNRQSFFAAFKKATGTTPEKFRSM